MSFSEEVKNELAGQAPKKTCCRKAFVFGLLINSETGSDGKIFFESEHEETASVAFSAIKEQFGKTPDLDERNRFGHIRRIVSFSSRSGSELLSNIDNSESFSDAVGFRCAECEVNFLRGVFLACAAVSDPLKSYHLEFSLSGAARAKLLFQMLNQLGFEAKIVNRRNGIGLCFKKSDSIEDILTYLGASKMLFECMNDKILRELRNDANRRANCEAGNIAKSVNASQEIISAIKKIEKSGRLQALPDDLHEAARIRSENPEASLSELCGMFTPTLSKSGLSHRFARIKKFAEEIGVNKE